MSSLRTLQRYLIHATSSTCCLAQSPCYQLLSVSSSLKGITFESAGFKIWGRTFLLHTHRLAKGERSTYSATKTELVEKWNGVSTFQRDGYSWNYTTFKRTTVIVWNEFVDNLHSWKLFVGAKDPNPAKTHMGMSTVHRCSSLLPQSGWKA